MRIVHIDFDDLGNPLGGGQPRRTFEINRRLAARHQVTVYTSRYPGSRDQTIDGVTYRRVGLSTFPGNFLAFFLLMPVMARRARSADVLVEDFTSPFSCGLTPLYTRTPVVASVQYFFARDMAAKYHLPIDLVERYGVRLYPNLIAPTRRVTDQILRSHPHARIAVIPQGVEPGFLGIEHGNTSYASFIGRIDLHQKGIDVLLNALSLIPPGQRPPFRIFGSGRDVQRMLQMIGDLKLGETVSYQGRVSGEDRLAAFAGSRFVCAPSRYDNFPFVVPETMAAARPVVGTFGAGFEEIFGDAHCGRLVDQNDAPGLAAAILELWRNPEICRRLGNEARERARAFEWGRIAATQEHFYESVARR